MVEFDHNPFDDEYTKKRFTEKVFLWYAMYWVLPFVLPVSSHSYRPYVDHNWIAFGVSGVGIFVLGLLVFVLFELTWTYPFNLLLFLLFSTATALILMTLSAWSFPGVYVAFCFFPGLLLLISLTAAGVARWGCTPVGGHRSTICLLLLTCVYCSVIVAPLAVEYPVSALEACLVCFIVVGFTMLGWIFFKYVLKAQLLGITPENPVLGVIAIVTLEVAVARSWY